MARESKYNHNASQYLTRACPGAVIYKHNDRSTGGIPDTSITWCDADSWLEFKRLEHGESIHEELEELQLTELVKIEQQTHRAWVIAFRKGRRRNEIAETIIYRPSALLHGRVPIMAQVEMAKPEQVTQLLSVWGVAVFIGAHYGAIAALIHKTHGVRHAS